MCQHTGYPVSVPSGEFWHTFEDFSFPGRGVPMALTHAYSSTAAGMNGPLGYGWTHSYAMSLTASVDEVTVREESGSEVRFLPTSPGATTYAPAASRIKATLVKNGDGSWTFTRRGVTSFDFDASGRLVAIGSLVGDPTVGVELTYDGSGNLDVVTDAAGRTLDVTWAGNRITSVTDSSSPSRTVTFTYDGAGDLVEWTDVGGGTWAFTYDGSHRLLTMLDPNQEGSGTPVPITNVYDSSGWVESQTDRLGRETTFDYTTIPGSVITTDPEGNATLERFVDGLRVETTRGYGTPEAATTTYDYTGDGLISSVVDPNDEETTFTYDTAGNRTSTVDPLLRESTATYNSFGSPLTVTDAAGTTTTYAYDANGNVETISTPLVGATPPADAVVTFAYGDNAHPGDVTAVIDPRGETWTYGYDADGNRASVIDPLGHESTTTFDDRGLAISTVSPRGNELGATPADFEMTYTHDSRGALLTVTDPLGGTVTNTYDANGNRTSVEDPNDNLTSYVYDAEDQPIEVHRPDTSVLTTEYWDDGTVKAQIDGADNATSYTYDPLGRLSTVTDALSRVTTLRYDPAGNLTKLTYPGSQVVDYGYDDAGRLTSATDWTVATSTFGYDADGNLTLGDHPATAEVMVHDAAGRIESIEVSDGFAGEYTDPENGFLYLRARHYDPATGQFLTRDPIVSITGEPYGYTAGNPLNAIDPTGLWPWDGKCVTTPWSDDDCDSFTEQNPEMAQDIVDFASGVLDVNPITATTNALGLSDTSQYANTSSGWYQGGQLSMFASELAMGTGSGRALFSRRGLELGASCSGGSRFAKMRFHDDAHRMSDGRLIGPHLQVNSWIRGGPKGNGWVKRWELPKWFPWP